MARTKLLIYTQKTPDPEKMRRAKDFLAGVKSARTISSWKEIGNSLLVYNLHHDENELDIGLYLAYGFERE